jgi:hypothetical protein
MMANKKMSAGYDSSMLASVKERFHSSENANACLKRAGAGKARRIIQTSHGYWPADLPSDWWFQEFVRSSPADKWALPARGSVSMVSLHEGHADGEIAW